MRISFFVIIFINLLLNSCIVHNISSGEDDDVYFIKKDLIPIEEEELEDITEIEEVK